MGDLGYVVIEWNQAGGQPNLVFAGDLHTTREDAEFSADHERERTRQNGRRERYAVAEVFLDDEEEPR